MNRLITLFIIAMMSLSLSTGDDSLLYAKKNTRKAETKESISKRKQKNKKEIRETSRKLEQNAREVNRKLNELNLLTAEIDECSTTVRAINGTIAVLDNQINSISDSISALDTRLTTMSDKYGKALRKMQTRNNVETSDFAFIFSANSFAEAYHRSQSLKQFAKWRKKKAGELVELKQELDGRKVILEKKRGERVILLDSLNGQLAALSDKKEQSGNLVTQLQREGKQLKRILAQKQKEADELDRELNRLIQLEQERIRKAEEERRQQAERERLMKEQKEKEAREKQRKDNEKNKTDNKPKSGAEKDAPKPVKPAAEKPKKEEVSGNKTATQGVTEFEKAKGSLPFPVKGKIVKRFGRQQHPELKHVVTDNPGIDIETAPGSDVRTVFNGYVSDIFRLPGYNTIVMIRHGNYLTIYANLGSISIKKGDKVSQGQVIGKVFTDNDDKSRSILHFEVRNERSKENPQIWLKQ